MIYLTVGSERFRQAAAGLLAPLLVATAVAFCGGSAVSPTSAQAWNWEYDYCYNLEMAPDETCPPRGNSREIYLYEDWANSGGASNAVCVDIYNDATHEYSPKKCAYYGTEAAVIVKENEPPATPRAWNAGTITHKIFGIERGTT